MTGDLIVEEAAVPAVGGPVLEYKLQSSSLWANPGLQTYFRGLQTYFVPQSTVLLSLYLSSNSNALGCSCPLLVTAGPSSFLGLGKKASGLC